MLDAADAAQFLAAAGAAGAAVDQARHRRAVAGGALGAGAIADQHATVRMRRAPSAASRATAVSSVNTEATSEPPPRLASVDRLVEIVIGHQRRHRAEGFDLVDGARAAGLVAIEQHRVEESAGLGVAARQRHAARDRRRRSRPRAEAPRCGRAPPRAARGSPARPCASPRRGDRRRRRRRGAGAAPSIAASTWAARRQSAADRGAFLPGLDRHLARDFLDEQIELRRARRGVGAEQAGVETVGLQRETHGLARRCADARAGARPVAAEPVKVTTSWPVEMIEEIADAAADQLQRALGQHAGFDDVGGTSVPSDRRSGSPA